MKTNLYIQSKTGGRLENQDFYSSIQTQYGELIVVCDGMGGHNGGKHAAETAVKIILEEVSKSEDTNPVNALHAAISKANTAIWDESQEDRSLKGMGTTVVALLLTSDKAICAHVGDSRIYQLRKGKILYRTFDHSHVFEMVKAGLITEEQARLSEKSNIITRALGIQSTVEIEITDNLSYQKGDRFLLCTDGIWGAVPEIELVEMVSHKSDIKTVVIQLVDKIDAIGFASGGRHDNLTAALIDIKNESKSKNQTTKPLQKKKKGMFRFLKLLRCMILRKSTNKIQNDEND
jgi:serine/threonine protein phosphatase PrpC